VSDRAGLGQWAGGRLGLTVGDGQCVALIENWVALSGKPHIWGNAADLLTNAPRTAYKVVNNSPSNSPLPGDVVVWGTSWGGGFGHTAVVIAANSMQLVVIEQNNPTASPPVVATHGYGGVIGWITW
jgi:hypothetical protein